MLYWPYNDKRSFIYFDIQVILVFQPHVNVLNSTYCDIFLPFILEIDYLTKSYDYLTPKGQRLIVTFKASEYKNLRF